MREIENRTTAAEFGQWDQLLKSYVIDLLNAEMDAANTPWIDREQGQRDPTNAQSLSTKMTDGGAVAKAVRAMRRGMGPPQSEQTVQEINKIIAVETTDGRGKLTADAAAAIVAERMGKQPSIWQTKQRAASST